MDIKTGGLTPSHFPLRTVKGGGAAYQNMINGSNLVRKAAQMVSDIEGLRNKPAFGSLYKPTEITEKTFQNLVDAIKSQLTKDGGKPFTLLNVIGAQETIIKDAKDAKKLDKTV